MAQLLQIRLVDDLDGGPAEETLTFSVDHHAYEIDLSAAHAAQLRALFAPYISTARRTALPGAPVAHDTGPGAARPQRGRGGPRGGRGSRLVDAHPSR